MREAGEISLRIHGRAADIHFKVAMDTGRPACLAEVADDIAFINRLPLAHGGAAHVGIQRLHVAVMVYHNVVAVGIAVTRAHDRAAVCGIDDAACVAVAVDIDKRSVPVIG